MSSDPHLKEQLPALTEEVVATYFDPASCKSTHLAHKPLPARDAIAEILHDFLDILYPGFGRRQNLHPSNVAYYVGDLIDGLLDKLAQQVARASRHEHYCAHIEGDEPVAAPDFEAQSQQKAMAILRRLPPLRKLLEKDVQAAYEGDPAAKSYHETIACYPGIEAVTVHRIAHEMVSLGVPLLPRMMSEYAHSRTGIDIHPGATIGPGFFIDHGTGVVIGETCEIGTNVKLYQGVTLGALSFPRDSGGSIIRGQKRHPTLEDEVVVYANATILGGRTVVGKKSVIGSNVWLVDSVPPETRVTLEKPSLRMKGPGVDSQLSPQI